MPIDRNALNLLSLAAIQGGNAFFPIILLPYYMMIFGLEEFSKFVASEAVVLVVLIVSLYGFDLIGIKKLINISQENIKARREVFLGILYARLTIFLVLALLLGATSYFFSYEYFILFMCWLLFPLGVIFQSGYYYQALESNYLLAVFVLISRIAACLLAFLLVEQGDSIVFGLLIMSGSYFVSGLFSLVYFFFSNGFGLMFSEIKKIPLLIIEGWVVFLGGVSVILYRGSNVIILTAVSGNPTAISLYAISEKFIKLIQALALPLSNFYTPRVIRQLADRKGDYLVVLWKNTKWQIMLSLIAISLFFLVALIERLTFANFFTMDMLLLVVLMVIAVPCGVANYMFGFIGLNILGWGSKFAKITAVVGVMSLILASFSAWLLEDIGVALVYGFSEVLILVMVFYYLRKYKKS